jgi:hypothetical protein
MRFAVGALVALAPLAVACGGDGDAAPRVLVVAAGSSIQATVDEARPGDVVLIEPGTYHEAVLIETADITLRGVDRNTVVLDGRHELDNGVMALADGVVVENMSIHSFTVNGVFISGLSEANDDTQLDGFRVSYVSAWNNGLYGLYAFQAGNGILEHSYVSGHPDSGIYVGQCGGPDTDAGVVVDAGDGRPCNVLVDRITAVGNAIGYSGTNASQVWVVRSTFRANRIGITPNSQSLERRAPQTEAMIVGNLVIDNDNVDAPEQASGGIGLGIAVGSGTNNQVIRNRVVGHDGVGIAVTTLDEFTPIGNRVEGNVLADNAVDLGYWTNEPQAASNGNCFVANTFESSSPVDIESTLACEVSDSRVDAPLVSMPPSLPGPDHRDLPAAPPQPTMPGDARTMPRVAPAFEVPDIDAIAVPEAP